MRTVNIEQAMGMMDEDILEQFANLVVSMKNNKKDEQPIEIIELNGSFARIPTKSIRVIMKKMTARIIIPPMIPNSSTITENIKSV